AAQGPVVEGVVRAASFDLEQRAVRVVALSPPDSDAEMSRVVSNGAGFSVLWLARRAEVAGPSDAASSRSVRDIGPSTNIEIPGEPRAYAWLEMSAVDTAGNATGPVQRLTASSGHVSAYDVQALSSALRPILIVARDDGETVDGSGGTLLRVRALGHAVEAPLAIASDGLGRGAPIIVDGPLPWLSWVGPREHLRLIPLDAKGDAVGPASAEEGLDDARPLVALPADGRMLVAAPNERSAQLRVFTCQR
ncbi:MAG: hypothetical protein M3O46_11685, partial [Myxococcota bacterium]|nr:hypothetical protein [Myxococcota bacterium]